MNSTRQCSSGDCGNCDGGAGIQLQNCTAGWIMRFLILLKWTSNIVAGDPSEFSDWSAWGSCSVTCGNTTGVQQRQRSCSEGTCGSTCVDGPFTDMQQCTATSPCPVDCQLSWGAWSSCSSTCGLGVQTRQHVVSQPALHGGKACDALSIASQPCLVSYCNDCDNPSNGPNGNGCFNGGTCVDTVRYSSSFTCACATGFSGSNCQQSSLFIQL